ncbi:MAG TPA: hypothetical protein VL361_16970 [Candidatus Limnocylindrales bacterium]|nr:hypothetical protein [Candidatus Limnocylindrales bacterium]
METRKGVQDHVAAGVPPDVEGVPPPGSALLIGIGAVCFRAPVFPPGRMPGFTAGETPAATAR